MALVITEGREKRRLRPLIDIIKELLPSGTEISEDKLLPIAKRCDAAISAYINKCTPQDKMHVIREYESTEKQFFNKIYQPRCDKFKKIITQLQLLLDMDPQSAVDLGGALERRGMTFENLNDVIDAIEEWLCDPPKTLARQDRGRGKRGRTREGWLYLTLCNNLPAELSEKRRARIAARLLIRTGVMPGKQEDALTNTIRQTCRNARVSNRG